MVAARGIDRMAEIAAEVARTLVPVFAVIALGWLLAARRVLATAELGRLAVVVCSPAFVFGLLSRTELSARQGAQLVVGALVAMGLGLVAGLLLFRGEPERRRGAVLGTTFWNSGNLAMSCGGLAWGRAGYEAGAVVFVTVLAAQSTLGIWIAQGRGGGGALLRAPLAWAAVLGLTVHATGVEVPATIMAPIDLVGGITIPLMLLTLGGQLGGLDGAAWRPALRVCLVRLAAGIVGIGAVVLVAEVDELTRNVLLLNAIMPGAVLNVVLAQRYGADPRGVASATVLGTFLTIGLLPILLALLHAR